MGTRTSDRESVAPAAPDVGREAARRRTFAIISHPDAGKTTLTEKLLLYAGAIGEAGAVKAHRTRREVTSDWMELERERGISVSSTVVRFDHREVVFNLLDTPGHRDFSEDTYRVLSAADSAIMLLDAAKGIEAQTLKLFEVARARRIPLLTFVNKLDRPSRPPLELLDEIERVLEISPVPATWPVGSHDTFEGIVDLRSETFVAYDRTPGGATASAERTEDARAFLAAAVPHRRAAAEEIELLEALGAELDPADFLAGSSTPVYFGSALSNFGVPLLLEAIAGLAPPPRPRTASDGERRALDAPFSAFVFKVHANMNPRHRDRVAFIRICSGRFEAGMKVSNARTGKPLTLSYAHELFGRERQSIVQAYPGDVVGLVNASELRIGDTLHSGPPLSFPRLPTLAPEHFVVARNRDSSRYKRFRLGLTQLDQEGVVQVLRLPEAGDQAPILAGVGPMQFEVATHRLEHEFGVSVTVEPTPYSVARVTDAEGERQLRGLGGVRVARRADGTLLALFHSEFHRERATADRPGVRLDSILSV